MTSQARKLLVFAIGDGELGRSMSDKLTDAGYDVVVVSSRPDAKKSNARRTLSFDLQAPDAEGEMARLLREAGPFDALVLADVVTGKTKPFETLGSQEWNEVLHQNATLGFLLCKLAVPVLAAAQNGGRIVFLLPEDVRGTPSIDAMPFVAAKGASVGLMRTLALEVGTNGITANAIACPLPPSGGTRPGAPDQNDVFSMLTFLLSPASGFLTGQVLDVNGGRSML